MLLALLLTWGICPGEVPVAYRITYAHRYVIATVPGLDDNGTLISEPIYNVWAETFIKDDGEMQAVVPCEPASGEVCAVRVTSLDEAGNEDLGGECS